ncbi:hypothetical protein, partial [Bowmanella yangjiangensis]
MTHADATAATAAELQAAVAGLMTAGFLLAIRQMAAHELLYLGQFRADVATSSTARGHDVLLQTGSGVDEPRPL